MIDFLLDVFKQKQDNEYLIWRDQSYSYGWLQDRVSYWRQQFSPGLVTILEADFSPNSIALLLAMIAQNCIIVPITRSPSRDEFIKLAQGQALFTVSDDDSVDTEPLLYAPQHELYQQLRQRPGLVLFSSGSTGQSKAAVHDYGMILEKFRTPRHNLRTIAFLLFDHIGGIDTLLYSLSNGSCLITVGDRSPDTVCQLIERYRAEVLPASPTFLNLLILRESYLRYDLSSLKYITYGTEVMPLSTLKRCSELFPNVTILQKYGTTEIGTLRSKSKASDSTWVKIGGDGYKTRIVDGILEIKARSAMLGYLNAASPFTADGWFHTGDMVEVDGDYIRILGRKSEIINVGGQKVYPAEVEGVIQDMPGVVEAVVYGEQNAITGQIVCAKVRLQQAASRVNFSDKLREFCRDKLELYKIPVKIHLVNEPQYSDRYKKLREVAK